MQRARLLPRVARALVDRAVGLARLATLAAPLAGALATAPAGLGAQVFLTQEEALAQAFGGDADFDRRTAYLTDEELARVRELVGGEHEVEQQVVTYYLALRQGEPVGAAYFDAHRVRTLPEVLMIALDRDGRVSRVEVLKFSEPPDYLAPEGWLEQFEGRTLDRDLSLKGDIVNMTGATLTSSAVTGSVRRALALHRVIEPFETGSKDATGPSGGSDEPRGGGRG